LDYIYITYIAAADAGLGVFHPQGGHVGIVKRGAWLVGGLDTLDFLSACLFISGYEHRWLGLNGLPDAVDGEINTGSTAR